MATIKDIAARSGVSIATVSKHINGIPIKESNQRRIDAAIAELGYQVNVAARTLKTRRSMTVGILLDSLSNLFYTSVISEVEELLRTNGYTAILYETKDSRERELQGVDLFFAKAADGILYFSSHSNPEIIRICQQRNIPLVTVDSIAPDLPDADFVVTENAGGAYEAVCCLLDHGHSRIGVITGESLHFSANERLRGYQNALHRAGIPLNPDWMQQDSYNIDGGYRAMKRILALFDRPEALLICNYFMAIGAIMALNEQNVRVPEEFSLITFDDIEWIQAIKPRLTTVRQQTEQIAGQAVSCLLARMSGDRKEGQVFLIPTHLTERDSVLKKVQNK
ncbi:MAG: LacI family DNA-binding transcriptional regulator [Candidatus Merdivicinus sp.]|jgi:LacI family transcriptional regulator